MDKGWIKIHRKILDCSIWNSREPFDKRSAWIDILLSASHKDLNLMIGGINEKIPRGSFMFSIEKLCDRWGWSRNRVKRFLALLEREQMIETKRTNKGTLISVLNYNAFQSVEEVTEKETEISDAHETAKKVARFIPPTVDEVQAYCEERKNGVDARCFVDFYESKNWVVGKAKMKNWKAAVRTWERNRRDKVTRNTVNANNSSQLQYLLESME
jgi:DNA-binding transcriptional regulator YhcF (GntR family)